jgi:DNA-binding NarL/FixJ family response regulator
MAPSLTGSSSATVLMIDDSPEDLDSWSKLLAASSSQYSILKAQTVRAGLDLCHSQKIDCVVLDLDMNDSSGFEVVINLIPDRKRPEIAVVILTHLKNPIIHEAALYAGVQACLLKGSTSARDLDEAIQKAIASVAPNAKQIPCITNTPVPPLHT